LHSSLLRPVRPAKSTTQWVLPRRIRSGLLALVMTCTAYWGFLGLPWNSQYLRSDPPLQKTLGAKLSGIGVVTRPNPYTLTFRPRRGCTCNDIAPAAALAGTAGSSILPGRASITEPGLRNNRFDTPIIQETLRLGRKPRFSRLATLPLTRPRPKMTCATACVWRINDLAALEAVFCALLTNLYKDTAAADANKPKRVVAGAAGMSKLSRKDFARCRNLRASRASGGQFATKDGMLAFDGNAQLLPDASPWQAQCQ